MDLQKQANSQPNHTLSFVNKSKSFRFQNSARGAVSNTVGRIFTPTRNVLPGHHLPGLQSLCSPGYQCGVGAVADFPVIFIFPGVCGDSRCKRSQGGVGQVGVGTRMWCGNLGWSGSGQLGDSGCTRVVWEVIRVEWIASGLSRGFMVIPLHMGCGVVLGQPPFGRGAAPATYRLPPVPGVLQSGQVAVMNMSCVRSV